ncbi:MAG: asparaginase [Pseudomonadota bacterium]
MKVVVLGTGGTIAGTADAQARAGYRAGQVRVEDLAGALAVPAGVELVAEQVAQVDSKDMDGAWWSLLAARAAHWLAREDVRAVLITHGTDTLEETAFLLHAVLDPAKPVVLTCAMRPASAPEPDGPQNLRDALAVALHPGACGVVAVCAGKVHGAGDVRKQHPYRLDAFGSGDAGCIAYVEAGRLRLLRAWPRAGDNHVAGALERLPEAAAAWPWVAVVASHAGADGRMVDALRQAGVQGMVVAGTGNATVHHALEGALRAAEAAGIPVVRATRCLEGEPVAGAGQGVEPAARLGAAKARVALQLRLLMAGASAA